MTKVRFQADADLRQEPHNFSNVNSKYLAAKETKFYHHTIEK